MCDKENSGSKCRVVGTTVVKPIVFGSISQSLLKKADDENHTHEWTVYVKPFHNEDMSNYVKKVQFKLHETYTNPIRLIF